MGTAHYECHPLSCALISCLHVSCAVTLLLQLRIADCLCCPCLCLSLGTASASGFTEEPLCYLPLQRESCPLLQILIGLLGSSLMRLCQVIKAEKSLVAHRYLYKLTV